MSAKVSVTVSRTPWERVSVRSDFLAQRIAESAASGSLEIDDTLCQIVEDLQSISATEAPLDSEVRDILSEDDSFDFTPTLLGPEDTPDQASQESPSEGKQAYGQRRFPRLVIV